MSNRKTYLARIYSPTGDKIAELKMDHFQTRDGICRLYLDEEAIAIIPSTFLVLMNELQG